MDVSTTFLNGRLEEPIYMVPPGFLALHLSHLIYKVNKSLYGLEQSPKQWYGHIHTNLAIGGLLHTQADSNVYYRQNTSNILILIPYVDDIYITGLDCQGIIQLKKFLQAMYIMIDLGKLSKFLGVNFDQSASSVFLHQTAYTMQLLAEY